MNKFVKSFLMVSFLTYAFAGLAFAEDNTSIQAGNSGSMAANGQKHYMGCIPPSKEKLSLFPKAAAPQGIKVPSKIDLSANFPTPGNQGQQGSCVGWATAYNYKTFQEKLDHKWDVKTNDHKFSPAYVYNQINGGRDQGSSIDDAMNLIKNQGVCSLQAMPYSDRNYTKRPTAAQKKLALPHKSKSWGVTNGGDVNAMKAHLAAGDAVTVGIPIYSDFDRISSSNPVYHGTGGGLEGYHALCIVGYDDSKKAFKFINSWGANWGINGYGYMGYDFIQRENITGYIMTDVPEGK